MILLRLITWPYLRKHVLRSVLTAGGIVLGVAVFVGMNSANESVLVAFSRTVDRIAGRTELQVSAGENGFPEGVLEQVQSAPSVRVAVPVVEAVANTKMSGEGSLLVLGVDFTGDRSLRDYDLDSGDAAVIDDPLVFLAQPDSIMLSGEFADRNGLTIGQAVALGTANGEKRFIVRGIMRASGLASAFGGNLAVMDIYAAQKMFGRGQLFDRIDLALKPGRTVAEATQELQALLGPAFQVGPPAQRAQQFETMIASFAAMMGACSLFALFIGMFIIYNSFAIAVTQRRSEIGILRALGATRRQIRWLFLGESAVTGFIGSLLGLAVGTALAGSIAAAVSAVISDTFGVAQETSVVSMSPMVLASAVAIGVVTSVVAALVPARTASRMDPVLALQKGRYQTLDNAEAGIRAVAAIVCAAASLASLTLGASRAWLYVSYVLAIMAALLLTPVLALALARAIRPLLKRARPVEGALAADSLIQAPRRTSATVAALMLSLALVVAFGGMARASYGSILDWVRTTLNPDLFVMPSHDLVIRTIRFPGTMTAELEAIPGIRRLQAVRNGRVPFRAAPVMLLALDLLSVEDLTPVRVVAGNRDMFRVAAAGRGVLVSANLAELQRLREGEMLALATPGGVIHLPIVGIVVDYSDQQGAILIDRTLFLRYWQDDSVNFFRVYLDPGANVADVKRRILERYAGARQVFVLNNDELKSYILRITDQWFGLTYIQVAVAVLVAILGIVNTLTVSIIDRRRELGVLRAVGGLKSQIRRTIWLEALSTGAIGLVLGFGLGAVNLYYILEIVRRDVAGMQLDYQFPLTVTLAVAPVILVAAFLAAIWPAETAVRGRLVEALEYE
jgi:putative ABC transport system permease protein